MSDAAVAAGLSPAESLQHEAQDPGACTAAAAMAQDLEAVVVRYQDGLINYLVRLVGCRARAEDLAQETFIRFHLSQERYQETGRLGGYLYRIATNLVRDEERRVRRMRLFSFGFFGGSGTDEGWTPEQSPQSRLLQQEARREVQGAIRALPLKFRAPLVLHEIEGLGYQAIADALQCKENTVKSRISRGRRMLEKRLAVYFRA